MAMIFPPSAIGHILPLPHRRNQLTISSNCIGEIGKSNKMGNQKRIEKQERKPRVLCLHGFRTSGEILKKQLVTKWPQSVVNKLDLVFVDAPFPCEGESEVEGIYDPPYYEWFQYEKDSTYRNFEECLEFIQDITLKQGPFDGLLGFSQGAILSATLPGLRSKGLALSKVPEIKFLIIIGGAISRSPAIVAKAYSLSSPVQCPTLHFLGKRDYLRPYGEKLLELCVDPVVIHHPSGHTIPRFNEKGLETMFQFLEKVHQLTNDTHLMSVNKNSKQLV
ncbi:hypothetical protein MKX03_021514 [Papaver bracteatum]|nr:hypothetical protein MKX03_021514 [Papaver bracteatum]